jgi:hypothetical protein
MYVFQGATKTYKIKPATPSDTDQREIIGKDPPAPLMPPYFFAIQEFIPL